LQHASTDLIPLGSQSISSLAGLAAGCGTKK